MSVSILFMSDWGSYPFYVDEGDGFFGHLDPATFQSRFHLPDDVVREILDWDAGYQAILNWDDPMSTAWSSPEAHERYIEQGRAASRLLRRHIPADVRIRYVAAGEILAEYY